MKKFDRDNIVSTWFYWLIVTVCTLFGFLFIVNLAKEVLTVIGVIS